MRILIAEDDPASQLVLRRTLEKLGHDTVTTATGTEAWTAYESSDIQLVISDWMMPEMTGLDLCRKVRARQGGRYTYFILLTALSGKGRYLEGMAAGADDFITKPFDRDELQARLHVAQRILSLQKEVLQLEGLLPICSYCKKIRDEQQQWVAMEQYIDERTDASFTHGVCTDCYENRLKPEMERWRKEHPPREV